MERVLDIARRHDLYVVEDCAIALGARIDGVHAGLKGDIGCFSFYPVKHITTGEGGMVITRRADVAERVSKQRAFGIDKTFVAERRHSGELPLGRDTGGHRDRAAQAPSRVPRSS
jgi:dTDP-4-amino-4,6-dideoxygalactose transaminase